MKAICKVYRNDESEICEMCIVEEGHDGVHSTISFNRGTVINSIDFRQIWEIWRGLERDIYG